MSRARAALLAGAALAALAGAADGPLPAGAVARLRVMAPDTGPMYLLSISPDGRLVASAGEDMKVRVWEVATGRVRTAFDRPDSGNRIRSVPFAPDGTAIACAGEDSAVHVVEIATGREIRRFEGHDGPAWAACFSPDGAMLASGGEDGTIRPWNASTGREVRRLPGHGSSLEALSFSPDGRTLASGAYGQGANSADHAVRLWDAATGAELARLEGHGGSVWAVAFSPDGRHVASGGDGGSIILWDAPARREVLRLPPSGAPAGSINAVGFSPDGRVLASGGDSPDVALWDVAAGAEIGLLHGHDGRVFCATFTPDGQGLATRSEDGTILVWDLALVDDLAGADPARAFAAVWALAGRPAEAIPRLSEVLRPDPAAADRDRIERMIGDLDDDDYAVRERASRALEALGEASEALLREVENSGNASPELRVRVEGLLEKLADARSYPIGPGETLRRLRAIQALERSGSREAREALEDVRKSSPSARERAEAEAAIGRMRRR